MVVSISKRLSILELVGLIVSLRKETTLKLLAADDYEKARAGSGWLKDLHELTLRKVNGKVAYAPNPETEE